MSSIPKNSHGFTLIEILLYLAISSALLLGVSGFITLSMQARAEGQVITEVEQQGERLMQAITSTIRTSSSITSPSIGSSAASLTLATPVVATNPSTFSLSSGTVSVSENGGAAQALTNGRVVVSGLTFTNVSYSSTPGTIRVQFTIAYNGNTAKREYNYSKVFYGTASIR